MDPETLLKCLKEHKVTFVVIGAAAFPVYGYARATFDLDLFLQPDRKNLERAWRALKAFGYDMSEVTVVDLLSKKVLIRQYAVATDLHPFVKGVTFQEVWKKKVKSKIGQTAAWFASLEDLIKMKRAAHRPKDLEDLKYLTPLRRKVNRHKI